MRWWNQDLCVHVANRMFSHSLLLTAGCQTSYLGSFNFQTEVKESDPHADRKTELENKTQSTACLRFTLDPINYLFRLHILNDAREKKSHWLHQRYMNDWGERLYLLRVGKNAAAGCCWLPDGVLTSKFIHPAFINIASCQWWLSVSIDLVHKSHPESRVAGPPSGFLALLSYTN